MYKIGLKNECKQCLPNCKDTTYTTSFNWSPMDESHMQLYMQKYGWDVKYVDNKLKIKLINFCCTIFYLKIYYTY